METGPHGTNGKICPDLKWGKMAEKNDKMEKWPDFPFFSVFFGHFFPFFDRGNFSNFSRFSHFCLSAAPVSIVHLTRTIASLVTLRFLQIPSRPLRSGKSKWGTSECTLVPAFGTGEHPPNHPFGNHPFANPRSVPSSFLTKLYHVRVTSAPELKARCKLHNSHVLRLFSRNTLSTPAWTCSGCAKSRLGRDISKDTRRIGM